jgi:hypothetical protein
MYVSKNLNRISIGNLIILYLLVIHWNYLTELNAGIPSLLHTVREDCFDGGLDSSWYVSSSMILLGYNDRTELGGLKRFFSRFHSIEIVQINQCKLINVMQCYTKLCNMAIRVVEFSRGGTKLERINVPNKRKLLNFEFWFNGKLSKIGHHFSNKMF